MKTQNHKKKSKTQFGLFLFFLAGLFFLQIAFAFTIHGDIGPHTSVIPGIEKPASPILVGRIDSLVSEARLTTPVRVAPEGAFAPASRDFAEITRVPGKIITEAPVSHHGNSVKEVEGNRFVEYQVQSGDTLDKISRKLFGHSQMVQSLVRINRIKDERNLQMGSSLKVPRHGLLSSIKVN